MKNFKICEYENAFGEKYYTVSQRILFFFWIKIIELVPSDFVYRWQDRRFSSYEEALEYVTAYEKRIKSGNYKRKNCTLV